MQRRIKLQIIVLAALFLTASAASAAFDPNHIISDEEMLDSTSLSVADIDVFLKNQNGYIANHSFKNFAGEFKSAAEIIYDAANNFDCDGTDTDLTDSLSEKIANCKRVSLNPKFLIVLLQKEQSLITDTSPTQSQLDWATGYGCPDGGGCNSRWQGFGKQVNSAALQFNDYLVNPDHYTYRKGNTYTISNTGRPAMQVTPANDATAALYNYTPHVYNGNFNFHKLWMRYFTFSYPNNTLLQVRGEPGVWLIKDGKKRPFLSKGALTSRYDINKVVQVGKSVIDQYPTGHSIKFAQYSLVRSPRGTIFLLVDDTRRGITSGEAFRVIGFNPEEVLDASWDDINAYSDGEPITATSSYPTGALLQDKKSGGIFYVTDGTKAPLWDAVLLKTKFRWKSITQETPEKLANYKTVEPAIFSDGELLKSISQPGVYVIDNKKRRPITSGTIFENLGYSWKNVITVPDKILNLYEQGDPIKDVYAEEEESLEIISSSTPILISSSTDQALAEEVNSILNP